MFLNLIDQNDLNFSDHFNLSRAGIELEWCLEAWIIFLNISFTLLLNPIWNPTLPLFSVWQRNCIWYSRPFTLWSQPFHLFSHSSWRLPVIPYRLYLLIPRSHEKWLQVICGRRGLWHQSAPSLWESGTLYEVYSLSFISNIPITLLLEQGPIQNCFFFSLDWGSGNLFCKGRDSKYFRLWEP